MRDIATFDDVPVFAVRLDADHIVVNATVRQRLEAIGVAPEHFTDMLFAG